MAAESGDAEAQQQHHGEANATRVYHAIVRGAVERNAFATPLYGSTLMQCDAHPEMSYWAFLHGVEWNRSIKRCTKVARHSVRPVHAAVVATLPPALQMPHAYLLASAAPGQ